MVSARMITIAKRHSSLLSEIEGVAQLIPRSAASSLRLHSIDHRDHSLRSFAAAANLTHQLMSAPALGSAATDNDILPVKSAFSPLGSNFRSFGRKGSRMGHHIEALDEMAHGDSRAEARHRREEKKKKSKKTRMSAQKQGQQTEVGVASSDAANDGDDDIVPREDEFGNLLLPESSAVRSRMLMVVASLERSFTLIRGGEATPEMFDAVQVSVYGETVPLSSIGQVVIDDPQRATISCYDPSVAIDVRDAVRDMPGLNLNPFVEEGGSGVVAVPIPRANEETRKEMVRELGRQAENGKQRVRNIRRRAMDVVNRGKQGKLEGISKDDAFRIGKDVDSVTEEVLAVLKVIVERKQRSVMED